MMKTAATTSRRIPPVLLLLLILNSVVVVVKASIWRPRPQIVDPLHRQSFLSSSPRIAPNAALFSNVARGGAMEIEDDPSGGDIPDVSRGGSTKAIKYGGASTHVPETAAAAAAESSSDSFTASTNTTQAASAVTEIGIHATNNNNDEVPTVEEIKAHKAELKEEIKAHKDEVKAHKAEEKIHRVEIKAHKAEVKAEMKAHKAEVKLHKIEEKARIKQEKKRHKAIAKKLKNRNSTNLRRKVLHASFGFFFAGLNHFVPREKFVPGMTILTSATLLMELLRYRKGFGWMNDIMHFVLGSSLRKHEMDGKFTGSFYYFLGVTITAALYPTSAATLGICQLAIADPTASYFGRQTRHIYWSRIENGFGGFGRNKGILGFLGGALACVPMNYYLLHIAQFATPVSQSSVVLASFALGFAGAFADLAVPTPALTLPKKVCGIRVPPFHVDDNVVVPIVSGFACTKVFQLLHWPSNLSLAKYLIF